MPWLPNGTFERVNPDYSATAAGVLWGQDLAAVPSIKIVATRHDFHDQDLGDGIAQCINITGYNSMLANLKMGDFKITDLGEGTLFTDAPTFGQIAGAMAFDDGLRKLELFDRNGNLVSDVIIPSGGGGGGEGTVTEVAVDATLQSTANPIVNIGTIGMKFLTPGQTYSGGIAAVTIDDYGRVTQVTTGGFANTNLSNTPAAATVEVESSTGNNTTLPAATDSLAGVMTATQFQQLAALVAAGGGGGGMQPPIFLSEQRMQGIWNRLGINQFQLMTDQVEFQSTASNTWQTAWTITGVGMLQLLALSWVEGGTGGQTGVRLLIDGNVVISETSVYNNDTDGGVIVVGYTAWGGFSSNEDPTIYLPENIAYNQSVQVQVRSNDIGPSLINSVNFRYQQFS